MAFLNKGLIIPLYINVVEQRNLTIDSIFRNREIMEFLVAQMDIIFYIQQVNPSFPI